jgi:hypothetical protein
MHLEGELTSIAAVVEEVRLNIASQSTEPAVRPKMGNDVTVRRQGIL